MSETAPEARPRGGGNMLTQKLGPLATWVWLLIATVIVGVIVLVMKKKSSSSASTDTAGTTANASQVPDIILQDYSTTVGTPAGSVPPVGTAPASPTPATPAPVGTQPAKTIPVTGTKPKAAAPKSKAPSEPIFNASYTVKKGQTLAEVAKQFGITREELAHANGFGTGAGLRTGQILKVPSPAGTGKPNPAK